MDELLTRLNFMLEAGHPKAKLFLAAVQAGDGLKFLHRWLVCKGCNRDFTFQDEIVGKLGYGYHVLCARKT